MLHVTPSVEPPIEDPGPRVPALLSSAGLHLLLILLVLWRSGEPPEPAQVVGPPEDRQEVALQPMPAFEPEQRQAPAPVPDDPIPLGPDSRNPNARVPQEQGDPTPPPEDVAPAPEQTPQASGDPAPGPQTTAERVTRAEETQQSGRIQTPTSPWGPSRTVLNPGSSGGVASAPAAGAMGRAGMSNRDNRAWRPSFPEAAGQCPEIPDFGTNPDGSPVLASVMGLVKDDKGFPLPNAHLQLVGHTFSTFSDRQGRYRLEFNPQLLERCRVQYIRVSADGYSGANLTLSIGRRVQSDDVILRRK